MLSRAEVINCFSEEFNLQSYLEIGVEVGTTFNAVSALNKVAVDPDFKVAQSELTGESFKNTSDEFFNQNLSRKFDLIFIDGLHTFEQSLRDFTRSLGRISDKGILILDDCFPSDYYASLRDHSLCQRSKENEKYLDRNWMGDVYKTVLFINEFFDNLDFSFIEGTMGVVAVWRAPRKLKFLFGESALTEIAAVDFARFRHDLAPRLPRKTLAEICASIKSLRKEAVGEIK